MTWYKFTACYGPGHQSGSTEYRWYHEDLSAEDKQEHFEAIFGDHDWPVGSVRKIAKLPKLVKKNKITGYESAIRSAEYMLGVLKKTAVKAKE